MTETPMRPTASIKVNKRFRRDLGDIPAFAARIAERGLLHPIPIFPNDTLAGGERRYRAFQHNEAIGEPRRREQYKGWTEIPVHVVDPDDPLAVECEENTDRLDFSPSELYFITQAREKEEAARAAERRGTRTDLGEIFHDVAGKTRDKLGALGNISGKSFDKLKAVFDAATSFPNLYGDIAEELDRTRNIDKAYVRLTGRQNRNKLKERPAPPEGKFETVVIDSPWQIERIDLVVAPSPKELDYETMTDEQIRDFYEDYVLSILADDAHVFSWTIQSKLTFTTNLMEELGLNYRLLMAWLKVGDAATEPAQIQFGVCGVCHEGNAKICRYEELSLRLS